MKKDQYKKEKEDREKKEEEAKLAKIREKEVNIICIWIIFNFLKEEEKKQQDDKKRAQDEIRKVISIYKTCF